jgi:hypothetical protein
LLRMERLWVQENRRLAAHRRAIECKELLSPNVFKGFCVLFFGGWCGISHNVCLY